MESVPCRQERRVDVPVCHIVGAYAKGKREGYHTCRYEPKQRAHRIVCHKVGMMSWRNRL
jgi:hypothetical protein